MMTDDPPFLFTTQTIDSCKVFEYQTETSIKRTLNLKDRAWKIENQILHYGWKELGLLYWKLKTLW